MKVRRLGYLGLSVVMLAGCASWFGDDGRFRERAMDYQAAESIEPLEIPPAFATVERRERYEIPPVGQPQHVYRPQGSEAVPRPDGLLDADAAAGVRLLEIGPSFELQLERDAAATLSSLEAFLEGRGELAKATSSEAAITTAWQAAPEQRKWWQRLLGWERGQERWIYAVGAGANGASSDGSTIAITREARLGAEKSVAAERDGDQVLARFHALTDYMVEQAEASQVASAGAVPVTAVVVTDGNDYPLLLLRQDYANAWMTVGEALERADLAIVDRNRSAGLYFLEADAEQPPVQVRIARTEGGVSVSVQQDDDTLAEKAVSARVIQQIESNLSR